MFKAPRLCRLLQLQNECDAKFFGELKDKKLDCIVSDDRKGNISGNVTLS